MAATRGTIQGFSKDGNPTALTSRLGGGSIHATADTWRTFTTADIDHDGRGYIQVRRDGVVLHRFEFGPEGGT